MKRLQFEIKIKPLSPVHIGIGGEKLPRKTYHLYNVETAGKKESRLALLSVRPVASRLLDHFGESANVVAQLERVMKDDDYPFAIARDIENGSLARRRMKVHTGASSLIEKEFKPLISLASGLPYIPGSSVKGALRTVWLDWQMQDGESYERFLALAKSGSGAEILERKQVADTLLGADQKVKVIAQNLDLFRAVSVSDLLPFADNNNTESLEIFDKKRLSQVYSVVPLSYEADQNRTGYDLVGGKVRRAKNNRAGAEAWECLDPVIGVHYKGIITIDIDMLCSMSSKDKDVNNLSRSLQNIDIWMQALERYSERFIQFEVDHYNMINGLNNGRQTGIRVKSPKYDDKPMTYIIDWLSAKSKQNPLVLPLGMGVGLMAHSVLGVRSPDFVEKPRYLGHELSGRGGTTMLGRMLTRSRYQDPEYPTPKSRRVVGDFSARDNELDHMKASRPLGWTSLTLTKKD